MGATASSPLNIIMKLFYGTGNPSKLRNLRALLEGIPIELVSPLELGIELPSVLEDGTTPWENARKKALAYYRATGMPSIGLDSGLYLEGLPTCRQPGTHVRRVGEGILDDEAFIRYYASLAAELGGCAKARFINGLCVVMDEEHIKCAGGPHISTEWFWIVCRPCGKRIHGFPMDSIAVSPQTGRYWVQEDIRDEQNAKGTALAEGIRQFFVEWMQGNYQSTVVEETQDEEKVP